MTHRGDHSVSRTCSLRRYARPPRGSPGRHDRSLHRWSISQHQDASELSVSVELSPLMITMGDFTGKRRLPATSGWKTAPTLPPLPQGSAVVHRGNMTHGVTLKRRTVESDSVLFRSCATQTAYFDRVETARNQQRRQQMSYVDSGFAFRKCYRRSS